MVLRNRPAGLLSRIARDPATLIRRAVGVRDQYGEWIEGAETSTDIQVNAQPPPGKDRWSNRVRELEEGGLRLQGALVFYTPTELRAAGEGVGADTVEHDGTTYTIVAVEKWPGHFAALASRVEPQPRA